MKVSIQAGAPYTKLQTYDKAGSYTWTAPNLFSGSNYKIGVCIVGGGGSGACFVTSSSRVAYIPGGGSGYVENIVLTVSPNKSYNLVVGKGGSGGSTSYTVNNYFGENGGASSFNGIAASGGTSQCDMFGTDSNALTYGGDPGNFSNGHFGGRILHVDVDKMIGDPTKAINAFENIKIVGSGSGSYGRMEGSNTAGTVTTVAAEKDPTTNKGGGDGAIGHNNASAVGGSATQNGCGGGSATAEAFQNVKATAGAGGDGLVIIYLVGKV